MLLHRIFGLWTAIGLFGLSKANPVVLDNGGYEGVVVGISEDVPNENCRIIINNLVVFASLLSALAATVGTSAPVLLKRPNACKRLFTCLLHTVEVVCPSYISHWSSKVFLMREPAPVPRRQNRFLKGYRIDLYLMLVHPEDMHLDRGSVKECCHVQETTYGFA
ncbi:hypothetical protein RUM44_004456 [Polyplax serrata]|uniref:Uncharacterized protein n=1 Tax=Polyplax serrata TaxID=468196 RepID=A0ABR1B2Y8_POLSC